MDIAVATRDYERWLTGHSRLIPADLKRKHSRMNVARQLIQHDPATYPR